MISVKSQTTTHPTRAGVDSSSAERESTHSQPTIGQRTNAILKGLDLVLEHHSAPKEIRSSIANQIRTHLDSSSSETVWLTRAKYTLTYPLSKYLRNPLPPCKDKVFVPQGEARRWMKARLNAFTRKNTHLWYSWLQCKRSSLPASKDIIRETYKKHFETLTRKDPGSDFIVDQIFRVPTFKRLLEKLKRKVSLLYSNASSFEDFTPSGSACFEKSRRQEGQFGELDFLARGTKNKADISWLTDLSGMEILPRVVTRKGIRCHVLVETRDPYGWDDWQSLSGEHLLTQKFFSSFQPLNCTIQGILEPFKVRVISKGNALPYYVCKPIQKALHSAMRDLDCFRLIGRPFSPTDMMDLSRRAEPTDQWFSIDYSAATDGLSWLYSGRIFEELISVLPEDTKTIARSVLSPHNLYYPTKDGKSIKFKGRMTNGQLMGSILSFPILCLANLGVYLLTTNDAQWDWSDEDRLRHVLVNGDDMVYAADPSLWDDHTRIAASVGLEMSVGKAYIHPVYANINSTSVHYDLRRVHERDRFSGELLNRETPWQIDYLNSGLFFGQHKVQENPKGTRSVLEPRGSKERKSKENGRLDDLPESSTPQEWSYFLESMELLEQGKISEDHDRFKFLSGNDTQFSSKCCDYPKLSKLIEKATLNMDPDYENLLSSLNWILKGSLPGKQKELLTRFIHTHKDQIAVECLALRRVGGKLTTFTRNLFIPIPLGGFGVDKPEGFRTKVSKVQLAVASDCIDRASEGGFLKVSSQYPLPGYELKSFEPIRNVPWRRKIAEKEMFSSSSLTDQKITKKFPILSYQSIPYSTSSVLSLFKTN